VDGSRFSLCPAAEGRGSTKTVYGLVLATGFFLKIPQGEVCPCLQAEPVCYYCHFVGNPEKGAVLLFSLPSSLKKHLYLFILPHNRAPTPPAKGYANAAGGGKAGALFLYLSCLFLFTGMCTGQKGRGTI
jgi:hypothetical protein